jgi:hypothetical protein
MFPGTAPTVEGAAMADQKQQSNPPQSNPEASPDKKQQGSNAPQEQGGQSQVQGEGNYEAGKQYQDAQRDFVESGRVQQAAQDAAPQSQQEAQDMARAEREGRSRAKEEDPQLRGGSTSGGDSQAH